MTFRSGLLTYMTALPVFFSIDMLWLGWLSGDLYQKEIGHLLGPINWTAALMFYVMFLAGIVIFAVRPGLLGKSVKDAALWGALFGLFTYGTYDLTNMATLKDWPWLVVLVDILWGMILCSSVSAITCWLRLRFSRDPLA